MNLAKVTAKGIAWGTLLLAAIFFLFGGYNILVNATDSFMSPTDFAKVVAVHEKTKPKFQKLKELLSKGHKLEVSFGQYEDLNEIQKAYVDLLNEHNKIYCPIEEKSYRKCSLYSKSADYVSRYSDLNMVEFFMMLANGEKIVEGLAREENYNKYNTAILVSAIAGGVVILLSLYSIFALILYARIGARGLAIVVSAVVPIYAVMLSFSYSSIDENFRYALIRDDQVLTVGLGMLYIFLVFPSLFLWLKSRHINLIDVILLQRTIGEQ